MSEDKVQEKNISKFSGINTAASPQFLPLEVTDDAENVFGGIDGTTLSKRPGLVARSAALPGQVFDMVRGSMYVSGLAGTASTPDAIHALCSVTATTVRYSYLDLSTDSIVNDATDITVPTTRGDSMVMVMTDNNHLLVTPIGAGANWNLIEHYQNTTPWYRTTTYAAPSATETYSLGAYHRLHALWAGQGGFTLTDAASKIIFSNLGAVTTFTAGDNFNAILRGRYPGVTGLHQAGDVTYIGAGGTCYALSGASAETFRVDRVNCDFSFGGVRGWSWDGSVSVGFTNDVPHAHLTDAAGGVNPKGYLDNIAILDGLSGKKIGDPVRSLFASTANYDRYAYCESWPSYNARLFLCSSTLALFHDSAGSFWKWTFSADGVIKNARSLCYADGSMHIASNNDYKIYKYSEATAADPATSPAAYWTKLLTSDMLGYPGSRPFIIEYARIYGTQTSGTAPTVQVDTNEAGNYTSSVSCALAKSGTQVNLADKQGYTQRLKITFGADGVQQKIYKIVLGIKVFPGR